MAEQLARLRDPAVRARMTSEPNVLPKSDVPGILWVISQGWMMQYEMGEGFDYEPTRDWTIEARAKAAGRRPRSTPTT